MFDSKFIKALHCIVVFVTKHYSVCDIRLKNKIKYKNCVCSRIDYTQLGPIDNSVLSQQAKHRSEAIWNGRVKHNTKYLLLHMHLIHTMYTYLLSYINPWFCYVQDPGSITCRSRSSEFSKQPPMVDD